LLNAISWKFTVSVAFFISARRVIIQAIGFPPSPRNLSLLYSKSLVTT